MAKSLRVKEIGEIENIFKGCDRENEGRVFGSARKDPEFDG